MNKILSCGISINSIANNIKIYTMVEFLEWGDKKDQGNSSSNVANDFNNLDGINLDDFQAIDEDDDVPF